MSCTPRRPRLPMVLQNNVIGGSVNKHLYKAGHALAGLMVVIPCSVA